MAAEAYLRATSGALVALVTFVQALQPFQASLSNVCFSHDRQTPMLLLADRMRKRVQEQAFIFRHV